jgi:hypothetical protein
MPVTGPGNPANAGLAANIGPSVKSVANNAASILASGNNVPEALKGQVRSHLNNMARAIGKAATANANYARKYNKALGNPNSSNIRVVPPAAAAVEQAGLAAQQAVATAAVNIVALRDAILATKNNSNMAALNSQGKLNNFIRALGNTTPAGGNANAMARITKYRSNKTALPGNGSALKLESAGPYDPTKPNNRNINAPGGGKLRVTWNGNYWQLSSPENRGKYLLFNNKNKTSAPRAVPQVELN